MRVNRQSCTNVSSGVGDVGCHLLVAVDILKDGADLIQSAVILLLALLAVLGYCAVSSLEELFIFDQSEICLIHLSAHILEVLKDPHLILLRIFVDESSELVFVVDKSALCRPFDVLGVRITPDE